MYTKQERLEIFYKKLKKKLKKKIRTALRQRKLQRIFTRKEIFIFLVKKYVEFIKTYILEVFFIQGFYKPILRYIIADFYTEYTVFIKTILTNPKLEYYFFNNTQIKKYFKKIQKISPLRLRYASIFKTDYLITQTKIEKWSFLENVLILLLLIYIWILWGYVFLMGFHLIYYYFYFILTSTFFYPGRWYVQDLGLWFEAFYQLKSSFYYYWEWDYNRLPGLSNTVLYELYFKFDFLIIFYLVNFLFLTISYLNLRSIFLYINQAYWESLSDWPLWSYLNLQIQQNPYEKEYYTHYLSSSIFSDVSNLEFEHDAILTKKNKKKKFLLLKNVKIDGFDPRAYLTQTYYRKYNKKPFFLFFSNEFFYFIFLALFTYYLTPFFFSVLIWWLILLSKSRAMAVPLFGQTLPDYVEYKEFLNQLHDSDLVWEPWLKDLTEVKQRVKEKEQYVNEMYEASALKLDIDDLKMRRKLFFHTVWLRIKEKYFLLQQKYYQYFDVGNAFLDDLEFFKHQNPKLYAYLLHIINYLILKIQFQARLVKIKNFFYFLLYKIPEFILFLLNSNIFKKHEVIKLVQLIRIGFKKIRRKFDLVKGIESVFQFIIYLYKTPGAFETVLAQFFLFVEIVGRALRVRILAFMYELWFAFSVYDPRHDEDVLDEAEERFDDFRDDFLKGKVRSGRLFERRDVAMEDALLNPIKISIEDKKLKVEGEIDHDDHEMPLWLNEKDEMLYVDDEDVNPANSPDNPFKDRQTMVLEWDAEIDEDDFEISGDTLVDEEAIMWLNAGSTIMDEDPQENLNTYFESIYNEIILHMFSCIYFFLFLFVNILFLFDLDKIFIFYFHLPQMGQLIIEWIELDFWAICEPFYFEMEDQFWEEALLDEGVDNLLGIYPSNLWGDLMSLYYDAVDDAIVEEQISDDDEIADAEEELDKVVHDVVTETLIDFYTIYETFIDQIYFIIDKIYYLFSLSTILSPYSKYLDIIIDYLFKFVTLVIEVIKYF